MDGWTVPSSHCCRGTTVGATDAPEMSLSRVKVQPDGTFAPIPREQWIEIRMEEQMDAMLYLGPKGTAATAPLSPAICNGARLSRHTPRAQCAHGDPAVRADRLKHSALA